MENYQEAYRGKTILVTGGAGAIGSNLSARLAKLGAQVIILDDLSSSERKGSKLCRMLSEDFGLRLVLWIIAAR